MSALDEFDDVTAVVTEPAQLEPANDEPPAKAPKRFSLSTVRKSVSVSVHFPRLYPDIEPFVFELGMKLSGKAEEQRQDFLALAPSERTSGQDEQNLDEICDLLVSLPGGFEDLRLQGSPGESFKLYVNSAPADAKPFLFAVVDGALTLYWNTVMPREFPG